MNRLKVFKQRLNEIKGLGYKVYIYNKCLNSDKDFRNHMYAWITDGKNICHAIMNDYDEMPYNFNEFEIMTCFAGRNYLVASDYDEDAPVFFSKLTKEIIEKCFEVPEWLRQEKSEFVRWESWKQYAETPLGQELIEY